MRHVEGRIRSQTAAKGHLSLHCLWEAILLACNYTSLIDNAEKLHWFGVSRKSGAGPASNYFSVLQCQVRFLPSHLQRGVGWDAADAITPEQFVPLSAAVRWLEGENHYQCSWKSGRCRESRQNADFLPAPGISAFVTSNREVDYCIFLALVWFLDKNLIQNNNMNLEQTQLYW